MKKVFYLLAIIAAVSCDEEHEPRFNDNDVGCHYSAKLDSPNRQLLGCITFKEFTDLNNPENTWQRTDDCSTCQ